MAHFSINAWNGWKFREVYLARLDFDWLRSEPDLDGWLCITVGLLGLCASLTYYPRGLDVGSYGGSD